MCWGCLCGQRRVYLASHYGHVRYSHVLPSFRYPEFILIVLVAASLKIPFANAMKNAGVHLSERRQSKACILIWIPSVLG
jgi:hypothetical protein